MSSGLHHTTVTLDGSGNGTGTISAFGLLMAVRVERSSGTPSVTITTQTDTVLSSVSFASDATKYPQAQATLNDGSTSAGYTHFYIPGRATVTVASGAAAGTVTIEMVIV